MGPRRGVKRPWIRLRNRWFLHINLRFTLCWLRIKGKSKSYWCPLFLVGSKSNNARECWSFYEWMKYNNIYIYIYWQFYSGNICLSDTSARRHPVGIRRSGRTFMTAEDVSELRDVFKDYLTEKRTPSVTEIKKKLNASKIAGGNIWQYDVRKLQKKLSAMVIREKGTSERSDDWNYGYCFSEYT